ncbi:hypothetical protein J8V57_14505 [Xenorhabdus sp. PB61.4]|uniref:colicin immunity domain-containing protein n=1 Tax=Xenorhabdus sp. PB61.4 TaxID=2788940 RepID=UPI001E502270|nr:colicin immunity domain-containing protein [Xenorhabdus sp. PB61.4]MCC8367467.1 hypothetical protein [Xenorhabdus sp. PB61.4]
MCSNSLKLIELIESYLKVDISPTDFEKRYIELWRNYRDNDDKSLIKKETQEYLDSIFCSLDAYCSDLLLRDENDLDENGLLSEVIQFNQIWKRTL